MFELGITLRDCDSDGSCLIQMSDGMITIANNKTGGFIKEGSKITLSYFKHKWDIVCAEVIEPIGLNNWEGDLP